MERRTVLFLLIGIVVAALGAAPVVGRSAAQEEPSTLVDFEDAPAGRSGSPAPLLGDFYGPDVIFTGTETALIFDGNTIPALPGLARSGSTVVTDCYASESCTNEITARFSEPQLDVEVWVGSINAVGEQSVVVLEGLDDAAEVVASDATTLGPSEGPIPVEKPLRIANANGRIIAIRVGWLTNPAGGLVIDDLTFTRFVAPPPPATDTPTASDGPAVTDVVVTTGEPTVSGSGSDGNDRRLLVILLVGAVALLAAVATLSRRAHRRRLRAVRSSIRVRGDEPTTDIEAPGGPLISVRVWMRPTDGTTTIEEGIEP